MTDIEKLRGFAQAVMRCWGGDIDGGDLQDWALQFGLLEERGVTEPCSPDCCDCAEVCAAFPTTCMFRTPLLTGKETPKTANDNLTAHTNTPEAK